jgi:hypothetical protein
MTVSNELLGASALTVIGRLMVVHAHAEAARPDPRESENNTFVECTTLIDKCMPGTSSIDLLRERGVGLAIPSWPGQS